MCLPFEPFGEPLYDGDQLWIVVLKSLADRDIPECIEDGQVEVVDEVKGLSFALPDLIREQLHLLLDHLLHRGLSKAKISESSESKPSLRPLLMRTPGIS